MKRVNVCLLTLWCCSTLFPDHYFWLSIVGWHAAIDAGNIVIFAVAVERCCYYVVRCSVPNRTCSPRLNMSIRHVCVERRALAWL